MKKTLTFVFRLLVLLCGIALAGFIVWQLFTNAPMLDVNVQTKGPVIIVIYSLVALITLGAAISFFTDKNMGVFEAVVENYISRGNVLRYTLKCDNVTFKSEMLFRSFTLFDEGQKVYVGIEPHNILAIKD